MPFDPKLDLAIEHIFDAPPSRLWRAWTEPEQLRQWFKPPTWTMTECKVDLRPGGRFKFSMRGPDGVEGGQSGMYVDVTPEQRLVLSDLIGDEFRPRPKGEVGVFTFTADGARTRFAGHVMHRNETEKDAHVARGYFTGWANMLAQLEALVKT
jgi:uncharacterized protein YndB with AHSA1/START domain